MDVILRKNRTEDGDDSMYDTRSFRLFLRVNLELVLTITLQ